MYYKVVGGENYKDVDGASVTVTILPKELYINDSDALLSELTALLGGGNVKIINTVHPKV